MYCYSIWNCYSICKVWYFPVRFIFLWQLMLPHLKSIWQIERIQFAKVNGPDQNAINLSSLNLTSLQKSLLSKGPSFVPTPKDVNWYELRKNFTKFVNQLRFKLKQYQLNQDHFHHHLPDKTNVMVLCITQSRQIIGALNYSLII